MKKIEKALKAMEDYNYNANIVDDKLYITAWDIHQGDSASFQVSDEEVDKWAADYDRERTVQLLADIRADLNATCNTIDALNRDVYEMELVASFPIKTLLSNIDCALDELQKINQ